MSSKKLKLLAIEEKQHNHYVLRKSDGKYFTSLERWSTNIKKAMFFENKKIHGFRLEDFPKGTKIIPIVIISQISYSELV